MELEKYLQAIENCPDEKVRSINSSSPVWRLTAEFGVYDNWPILLKHDFESAHKLISGLGYSQFQKNECRDGVAYGLNRDKGIVELWLKDYDLGVFATIPLPSRPGSEEHRKRQMGFYNIVLVLHPYQEDSTFNQEVKNEINWCRGLALAITEIGRLAIARQIPLCFPESLGDRSDCSQIVYFPAPPSNS